MLGSVIRVHKKYYPQTLLEEYKNIIKNNKIENHINDDLDLTSSDNESDNEFDNELIMELTVSLIINLLKIKKVC